MDKNKSNTPDKAPIDISKCRIRRHDTGILECRVAGLACPWRLSVARSIGSVTRLCSHPSSKLIGGATA